KEGMVQDLVPLVSPVSGAGKSAIALRDLDDLQTEQVGNWFTNAVGTELSKIDPKLKVLPRDSGSPRILFFTIPGDTHTGRVVVVPIGLPGESALEPLDIKQFT